MMTKQCFAIAITCLVFTAACNRDAEPEVATPVAEPATDATADATIPAPDAGVATGEPMPVAAEQSFMMKTFAGTFSADGSTVTLNADGSYASKAGDATSDGTWTADAQGTQLLLDPNSKSESDQAYSVVSQNEIRAADGSRLQREGVAR